MQPEQLGASWTRAHRAWAGPGSEHLQSPTAGPGAPLLWSWNLTSVELSWWPCEYQARRTPGPTDGSPRLRWGEGRADHSTSSQVPGEQTHPKTALRKTQWGRSNPLLPCTTTQKHIWDLLLPTANGTNWTPDRPKTTTEQGGPTQCPLQVLLTSATRASKGGTASRR